MTHKVRIINDLSFDEQSREKKGGLNGDIDPDTAPQCLCAEALPKFLDELVTLRKKLSENRILMSKVDLSDAFRNVRVDLDKAHNFCYTVRELVEIDFCLTFGWSRSPGFWGVMSAAAAHVHCNTTIDTAQLLGEGKNMMAHVRWWSVGKTESQHRYRRTQKSELTVGGGEFDPFFTAEYVDGYLQVRIQHSDDDATASIASASLGSNHVRLFGPGEMGVMSILAPKKSTNWDTTIDAQSFTISSHIMRISVPRESIQAIKILLFEEWPQRRREATARDVLSMAGEL